jgi:hypothetical protein
MACREQINGDACASPTSMCAIAARVELAVGSLKPKPVLQSRIIHTVHGLARLIANARLLTSQAHAWLTAATGLQTRRTHTPGHTQYATVQTH